MTTEKDNVLLFSDQIDECLSEAIVRAAKVGIDITIQPGDPELWRESFNANR